MKPLPNTDKKKILAQLEKQYGINHIPQLIIQFGQDKLRLYNGNLSKEDLYFLDNELRIENLGLYFAKYESDGIRLTIDGLQLFKNQISKNILEINDEHADQWLRGNDLSIESDNSWKILKHKNELLGCGKSTGERITNFMPKERRVKN